MLPHVALFGCLLIVVGLCDSASINKMRIVRDTRNIPTSMFKPLNNNNNNSNMTSSFPEFSLSEHSTGEAHAVTVPPRNSDYDYEDRFPSNRRNFNPYRPNEPSNFGVQSRFQPTIFESTRNSQTERNGWRNFENIGGRRIGPFPESGSIPLMASSNPFGSSGSFGGLPDSGSSSNFYRSESYSYSSDGNGPPQVERNVYDSRIGHGITLKF